MTNAFTVLQTNTLAQGGIMHFALWSKTHYFSSTIVTNTLVLDTKALKQWHSQGGNVMRALLGHVAKGEGNVVKQLRIRVKRKNIFHASFLRLVKALVVSLW